MRNTLILTFFLLSSLIASAQTDFNDLFESMKQNDRFSNMLNLRHYQNENPDRAIVYFLLGDIADQYLRETDPLRYFFNIEDYNNQTQTYYSVAKIKLNEKQVRQDQKYYEYIKIPHTAKKICLEDIIAEVDKRFSSAKEYYENARTVNKNYISFTSKYNECLFEYRDVLKYFPYYKDLCMLVTPELQNRIIKIGEIFDEAVSCFKTYSEASKKVAYFAKPPEFRLKPVTTYRLEGLVESDYSAPLVELWDYKSWVGAFINTMNGDIKNIRNGLIETDTKLDNQIKSLQDNEFYSDELTMYNPDEHFQFLIAKYDYNSLSNKLLNYKKSKVSLLRFSRSKINDPLDSSEVYMINRLTFYKDLANQLNKLNKEAVFLRESVTLDDVGRNLDFFNTRYQGMDRLVRWCNVEQYNNLNIFNKNLKNFEFFLNQEKEKYCYTGITALFAKRKVALGIQHPDSSALTPDTLITQKFLPFGKTTYFLAGIEVANDSFSRPFVAQSDTGRQFRWLVIPHIETGKNAKACFTVADMKVLNDSTTLLLISGQTRTANETAFQNYVLKYDWKGKESSKTLIDTTGIPQFFYYDDIANEYFLISRQEISDENGKKIGQINCHLSGIDGESKWLKSFLCEGDFVDMILTNSNFFVFLNANKFEDKEHFNLDGRGKNSALGIYINHDGTIKNYCEYHAEEGISISRAVKINSNTLNIFGRFGLKENSDNRYVYFLIDTEGNILFKNDEDMMVRKTSYE